MNRQEKTILVTIVANFVLVALKYGLAAASGSLALRASTWHSLGDVFVSLLVLGALFMSRWETRRREGVSVAENVVALIVAVFMFYTAYDVFRDVVGANELPDLQYLWPVTIGSLLTIVITYFIARYKEFVGRATNSLSLLASGYHSRMDLYASVLVVVGLLSSALGLGVLDRLAAVVVILLIVMAGWEIAESAIKALRTGGFLNIQEAHIGGFHWHGGRYLPALLLLLAVFTLLSGFYAIRLGEQAVVRRFGRVIASTGPGLHYRFPFVDTVSRVAVDEVQQIQTEASLVLTGDTDLVSTQLGIQYIITDPSAYLFNVSEPAELITKEAETALRQAVAERGVDDLLSAGREAILAQTLAQTQTLLNEHDTGLKITNIQLLAVTPPEEVADAFRDVASAREDKDTYINEALAYRNETVATARGEAAKNVLTAQAERDSKVNTATGESAQFVARLAAYQTAPAVTRTRLYLEALEKVLPDIRKYILDPRVQTDSTDLWISNKATSESSTLEP